MRVAMGPSVAALQHAALTAAGNGAGGTVGGLWAARARVRGAWCLLLWGVSQPMASDFVVALVLDAACVLPITLCQIYFKVWVFYRRRCWHHRFCALCVGAYLVQPSLCCSRLVFLAVVGCASGQARGTVRLAHAPLARLPGSPRCRPTRPLVRCGRARAVFLIYPSKASPTLSEEPKAAAAPKAQASPFPLHQAMPWNPQ